MFNLNYENLFIYDINNILKYNLINKKGGNYAVSKT